MCTWRCFAESTMIPESDLIYENSNNQLQDRDAGNIDYLRYD